MTAVAEPLEYRPPRREALPAQSRALARVGLGLGLSVPVLLAFVPFVPPGPLPLTLLLAGGGCWVASIVLATLAFTSGEAGARRLALLTIVVAASAFPAVYMLCVMATPV